MEIVTTRTGATPLSLARVNVLLGANGTGKSKLLQEIRENIPKILPNHKILNIEGGRALQMYDTLQLDSRNFNNYSTYEQTYTNYNSKRSGTLQNRLFDGLKSLELLGESTKIKHSDEVVQWHRDKDAGVATGDVPRRPVDPMERVFELFNDIFSTITLKYYPNEKRLRCRKGEARYGPTTLSDGEKQVFSILVDVVELAEEDTILFVDEPELNLNPGLANRLWSAIEGILPRSIFLYATHSVSFAMRESVEHIYVISNADENIQKLDNMSELSRREQEELLGNITSLLANKKTLIVEGESESFDSIFYDWILGDKSISPSAVGGCEDVSAIIKRSGKWERISPNVLVRGVVDRDFRGDVELAGLEKSGVQVLDFHEAESYLCFPEIIVAITCALGTAREMPTESQVTDQIVKFAADKKIEVVAKRVAALLNVRVGVSVPSKTLKRISDVISLKRAFFSDAAEQKNVALKSLDEETINALFENELKRYEDALADREICQILRLVPGKELLKELAKLTGCADCDSVARAARRHVDLSKRVELTKLSARLRDSFASNDHSISA